VHVGPYENIKYVRTKKKGKQNIARDRARHYSAAGLERVQKRRPTSGIFWDVACFEIEPAKRHENGPSLLGQDGGRKEGNLVIYDFSREVEKKDFPPGSHSGSFFEHISGGTQNHVYSDGEGGEKEKKYRAGLK